MGLSKDDVDRILRVIDESGYDEIKIEYGDLKLHVRRHGLELQAPSVATATPTPVSTPVVSGGDLAAAVAEIPEGLTAVRAPMLGTFYRSSSPGTPPFIEEGAMVRAEDTVCLIEVMKLFNTLRAGTQGRVVSFLVENGAMVEYDQPLLLIDSKA